MADPIAIHRKELVQRLHALNREGGWEGSHTDFKRDLPSTPRQLGKIIKHILAFANTPRRTDAFIIFGVEEDKDRGHFSHVGVPYDAVLPHETLEELLRQYTSLEKVVIDRSCVVADKRTPYIVIPLQYQGPYMLSAPLKKGGQSIQSGQIYCRYGTSSLRATDRDARRMRDDWIRWFLDCRYEENATTLIKVLADHFPKRKSLIDAGDHVRLVYNSVVVDEFGSHEVPALLHAYWGFDQVQPSAVERIVSDTSDHASQRAVVGARFAPATSEIAKNALVRCISLDEIYFVNDSYAQLCRAFARRWMDDREGKHPGLIVDLDYRVETRRKGRSEPSQVSVLSFLEEQIQTSGRTAIVVHGGFGCGKTTTAKQFAATLSADYLRGAGDVPKVLYLDVNNIDLRTRREECIESQLMKYRLPQEVVDRIASLVQEDEIHLLFDGVDEMAKPHTVEGRSAVIEILRDVGNHNTTVYFIRTSYYPQLDNMISELEKLADYDFTSGEKRIVAAEIRPLRAEQVDEYLESRLGPEDTQRVRGQLSKMGVVSFLADPLIVSFVADLVETEGPSAIESFSAKKQKAHFLSRLVRKLLEREQKKRHRHGIDFESIHTGLRAVGFKMVSDGITRVDPERFGAIIGSALGAAGTGVGAVDAFRTVSWIQRTEDGALTFRHEALTVVCAAEFVCGALQDRDALALTEWRHEAPLADVLYEYAGEIISSKGLLGGIALLGSDIQFSVRQLITGVLDIARTRDDFQRLPDLQLRTLGPYVRGVARSPSLAEPAIRMLFESINERQMMEIGLPILLLLAPNNSGDATRLASTVLGRLAGESRNFYQLLHSLKSEKSRWIDALLLKDLGIKESVLFSVTSYEQLFRRLEREENQDSKLKHYVERTLAAIEEENHKRARRAKADIESTKTRC
jgi:hypothetical protein